MGARSAIGKADPLMSAIRASGAGRPGVVPALSAAAAVLVGLTVAIGGPVAVAGIVLAVTAGLAVSYVPVARYPAIALCLWMLVPTNDLPGPAVLRAMSPFAVLLIFWALYRGAIERRKPAGGVGWFVLALASALVLSTVNSISYARTAVWGAAFVVAIVLPAIAGGSSRSESDRILTVLITLASILSLFGLAEFALEYNPLAGLYSRSEFPLVQHWGSYRITTTLGHPLNNALVFGTAAVAGFARYLERRRDWFSLACAVLCSIGLLLTGSRGMTVVTGAAVLVAVLTMMVRGRGRGRFVRGFALLAAFGVVGAALYGITIAPREKSGEATASSEARSAVVRVALDTAATRPILGFGPGTSNVAKSESSTLVLENSYLQLLVSIGAFGVLTFVALVAAVARAGLRADRFPQVAALLVVTAGAATYNFAEGVRSGLLFVGLLLLAALPTLSGREPRV